VFFDYQGHVLILRHVYRHHHPWGLPAGFIDAGETPEAGILRELEEETAMVAHITRVLAVTSLTPRHLEVALLGSIDSAQTPSFNHEIFESSFVDPKNLPDGLPSSQKAVIESASHSLNPASA
jgi:ADP-ribose pyrophosphatase YjhB (NUDIX family)